MAVIEGLISTMCALSPAGGGDACNHAMDATTRSIVFEQKMNKIPDIYFCQKVMAQPNPNKYDLQECLKGWDNNETNINVKDEMNGTENKVQQMALQETYDLVGKNTVYGIGGAAALYKVYTDKKFTFDVPGAFVCDKIHLDSDFNQSTYGLRLQWNFK